MFNENGILLPQIRNKTKFSDGGSFSIFGEHHVLRFHRGIVRPPVAIIQAAPARR
jgi:hypothetical protein